MHHIIHAIQLGVFHNVDYSHLVLFERYGEKIDASILSYLALGKDSVIIIDTGLIASKYEDHEFDGDPERAFRTKLKEVGLEFTDVTHIIHTHLHFDHVELDYLFPNAKIYVQRMEMAAAVSSPYPVFYDRKGIGKMIMENADRIVLLDGDTEIVPGIDVVLAGAHTEGSQIIYLQTSEGIAAIPGDLVDLYANLEIRSPKIIDCIQWVKVNKRIKEEAEIVLPSHDPEVIIKHPVVGA